MVELKNISKFFLALTKAGGQLSRTDLAVKIFGRNWSAKKLDELLASPLLVLLIDSTKKPIRGNGRKALRYFLLPLGWQIARTWKLPVTADRINPEEVQHQFGLLVKDGHPWAKNLERDAGLWCQHAEQEEQLRAKKAAEREEKERTRPEVKQDPANKKPHPPRGLKSDSDRARFLFSKRQERESPPHPAAPTPLPARMSAEQSRPRPVYSGDGGFRQPAAPLPATASVAQRPLLRPRFTVLNDDTSYLSAEACAEIRKITAAGYRCNEKGEVFYDNKWISRAEWKKKMPGVLE